MTPNDANAQFNICRCMCDVRCMCRCRPPESGSELRVLPTQNTTKWVEVHNKTSIYLRSKCALPRRQQMVAMVHLDDQPRKKNPFGC